MSDQPDATPELIPASPAALRDTRWLAGAIWGGLLLALIVTSWAAVTGGGAAASVSYFTFLTLSGGQNPGDASPELVATVALLLSGLITALVVLAWLRFANATVSLVSSLSDSSDDADDQPATIYWLPSVPGERSQLVDLLGLMGLAWGVIILRPIVTAAIQIYAA